MILKNLYTIPSFQAGDATRLREWLHPKNDAVNISYSIAFAELEPGTSSLPHILQTRSEVYLVLEGEGVAYLDGQAQQIQKNDLILIPEGVEQYIENVGSSTLKFICIVSPPWAKEDEIVME